MFSSEEECNNLGGKIIEGACIVEIPLDKAYEMRAKWSYPGGMEPKRTESTMLSMELEMLKGKMEPIRATQKDIEQGLLKDGKHRIILAKKLKWKTISIKIFPPRYSGE